MPESLVQDLSCESYQKIKTQHNVAQKYEQTLSESYQDTIKSSFEFKFDTFGGYRLSYEGKKKLSSNAQKRHKIQGLSSLIQRVPKPLENHFKPVSVFAPTELCSQMRIMVAPVRFVNHS